MEGVELTKVKYIHSGDRLRHPLNMEFGINNERQNCKISSVLVGTCGRGRVNGGDESEGIWLMGFI
jgi:hypothetical protein